MIEKKMVGSRFNKKTFEERIQFIGFPEHINDDFNIPHYHLLVKFPDNIKKKYPLRHKQIFKDNLYNSWRKFVEPTYKKIKPDGSSRTILDCYKINRYCDVRRIRSKRAVDYVTKDLGRVYSDNEEHIIFNETPFK